MDMHEHNDNKSWAENRIVRIGVSLNPSLALINHSCDPNYARVVRGKQVLGFSTRKIRKVAYQEIPPCGINYTVTSLLCRVKKFWMFTAGHISRAELRTVKKFTLVTILRAAVTPVPKDGQLSSIFQGTLAESMLRMGSQKKLWKSWTKTLKRYNKTVGIGTQYVLCLLF